MKTKHLFNKKPNPSARGAIGRYGWALCLLCFCPLGPGLRAEELRLNIGLSGTNAMISWANTGATLEQSFDLLGPWSEITGATSPHRIALTNGSRFFRLRGTLTPQGFGFRYVAPEFTTSIGDPFGCGCTSPENPNSLGEGGGAQDNGGGAALLHTGELTQDAVDLEIPGRGFNWRFSRRYRSGMSYDGPMGQGWDFNYNRRLIVETNGNVLCVNGLGRVDRYTFTGGAFQSPSGIYTVLTRNGDGTFTERDRHGGTNSYSGTNGLGIARLTRVSDRNGNQMAFQYNAAGQLTNVVDTLARNITYGYDANGRLTNVTDFVGRSLRFAYDASGNLVSATSPAVTGTPNGNDFPSGKTVLYNYASGFGDGRFNHNLLSVTAPNEVAVNGPPRLVAQYDTNPLSPNADRLVSLRVGGTNASGVPAGGVISYNYASLGAATSNDFVSAVFQTTATNRNGNVTEYLLNQLGNIVQTIRFTRGLRAGEPAGYTNTFAYNRDGELIASTNAELDSVQYTFDSSNPDRLQQGNLLQVLRLPGPRGGDQAQIVASMTYQTNFNFVATSTDARTNVTTHRYDSRGNRTNTIHRIPSITEDIEYNQYGQITARVSPANDSGHRRRDVTIYYTNGPQTGYVQSQVVDSGGFNLTTVFEHNAIGNLIRTVDGRGNDSINIVNSLNQVVRRLSRSVATTNGPVRYQTDIFYDANNNTVRMEVENRDDSGAVVASNPSFTTTATFDILDILIATAEEVATGHNIQTEHAHDANQNRTQTRFGEATAGRQPNNAVRMLYDERDLLFRETRAPGVPEQSTTQSDYNGNGELVRTMHGIEDPLAPHVTLFAYDGFGRLTRTTDAMGNVTQTRYDPNGNRVEESVFGELIDIPGQAGNTNLSKVIKYFDAMDRAERTDVAFFDTQTGASIGDGLATTQTSYAPISQAVAIIDDNGHQRTTTYDTANRLRAVTDAKGNSTVYTYDANGNTILMVEVEKSDLGDPDQLFNTTSVYDALDRLVSQSDNMTNTVQYAYNSRNNRVLTADARGNATRSDFDGLNRLVRTVRDMDGNGPANAQPGDGNPDIVTTQVYDDSSRLTAQTDDNGNATKFAHDPLNRQILTQMADGTLHQLGTGAVWPLGQAQPDLALFFSGYDVHGNRVVSVDANGTRIDSYYDLSDRLVTNLVTRATGVLGTTRETFQYDGLSRIVQAQDDDSLIVRSYNSLSHTTRETQQPSESSLAGTVIANYDAVGNQTRLVYPGGRTIIREFNERNLPIQVDDAVPGPNSPIAEYFYVGRSRPERRDYGNATSTFFSYDGVVGVANAPGDFGVKRLATLTHFSFGTSTQIGGQSYSYDRNGNLSQQQDFGLPDDRLYSFDAVNRLAASRFVTLGQTNIYNLDGVGNRLTVISNGVPGIYTCNAATPHPADCQVNHYTTTPFDTRAYDLNGNLTNMSLAGGIQRALFYDFRNQLVQVVETGPAINSIIAEYRYDVFGRRTRETASGTTTLFYYDGSEDIEDRDIAGAVLATYVHSNGRASLLQMQRSGTSYFFHGGKDHSVLAVSDASGAVVERLAYDPYGSLFLQTLEGITPFRFAGSRHSKATGLLWKDRYLDSGIGRFISGDFDRNSPIILGMNMSGLAGINLVPLASFTYTWCWSCSGCEDECLTRNEGCTVGTHVDGPEVDDIGPIHADGGSQWKRVKFTRAECVEVICNNVFGRECCRYTRTETRTERRWKKSGSAGGGTSVWTADEDAIPCDCGTLLEIAMQMPFVGWNKAAHFEKLASGRCPGLSWANASAMAANCGFGSLWNKMTTLSGRDWYEFFEQYGQLFGTAAGRGEGRTPIPPDPPPVPTGPNF